MWQWCNKSSYKLDVFYFAAFNKVDEGFIQVFGCRTIEKYFLLINHCIVWGPSNRKEVNKLVDFAIIMSHLLIFLGLTTERIKAWVKIDAELFQCRIKLWSPMDMWNNWKNSTIHFIKEWMCNHFTFHIYWYSFLTFWIIWLLLVTVINTKFRRNFILMGIFDRHCI